MRQVLPSDTYLCRCQIAAWKEHKKACRSETAPERPDSPGEVTGSIERMNVADTASNSDDGQGGGGAAYAQCGIHSPALKSCARCLEVAYCGKE